MIHVTINEIKPVLPFAGSIALRNNYLAFSFPISLTIMGTLYTPFFRKFEEGEIRSKAVWEAQYAILVAGVFSLFGAILFDNPQHHRIFALLQVAFSAVLVFSIVVFAYGVFRDRRHVLDNLPAAVWRYVVSAIVYLSLAGLAGLGLGYGVEKGTHLFYFLIQGHVHLALLGWVGMGMTGAVLYVSWLSGRQPGGPAGTANHLLMHAGIITMTVGIYFRSLPLRAAAGIFIIISVVFLLVILTRETAEAS